MKWKRITAILMTAVMVLTMPGVPTMAMEVGAPVVDTGLCEHHPEHTEDCGYTEGEAGTPCGHEHTEECYTLVKKCVHEHDESCYSDLEESGEEKTATASEPEKVHPTACEHECSEESGCITKELNCAHERGEHDETCGYVPAKEGTPCAYVCEICDPQNDSESGQKTGITNSGQEQCSCITLCTEDNKNTDCPVCSVENADFSACFGKEAGLALMAAAGDVQTISGDVTWDNQNFITPFNLKGNTTITLIGENSIKISDTTEFAALDMSDFDLTIQGTGSLTVEVPTGKSAIADTRYSRDVSTTLTIRDAKVNTKGGSSGLKAKAIVIESGNLNLRSDFGITTESLTMSGGTLYATGSIAIYSRYRPERNINSGLTILYSDKSNADVEDMLDGTVDDTKKNSEVKTIYIANMPARARLTVDTQQGTLREGLGDQMVTFSVNGKNVEMDTLTVAWEGDYTGLTAESTSDGGTITVTADNTVKEGTYKLKLTADGVENSSPAIATATAMVTVSGPPITIDRNLEITYQASPNGTSATITANASLADGLPGEIAYQWYVNGKTFTDGGNSNNSITLTKDNLTTPAGKDWEHSGQVYCELSYRDYTVKSDPVSVTISTCTHKSYTHEGKCTQCGEPCDGNVLFISEDGVPYVSVLDDGKALIGAAMSSGGTYYFVRDVNASLKAGHGNKIDADLTLELQNHKIKELDLQDFPHNSVTIKNGTVQNVTAESAGRLVLDDVTIETQTNFSDKFDLTVKGDCVFPNNMTFSGKTQLQGGTFSNGINVTTEEEALALLADGYAFAFDHPGAENSLVDVSMESGRDNVKKGSVKVISHSCQYVNGKCACGRSCDHEGKVDTDGYCTFCNALVEAFETGGKRYTSLESALAAATDESTIYLRGDLQLDRNSPIEISKNVLLDLQGHTLRTPWESELLCITGSNVAIINGAIKNTSVSKSTGAVSVGALRKTGAKLTVENVTFEGSIGGGIEVRAYGLYIWAGNEAVVNSGTFTGGIYTEGKLTMSGGKADRLALGSNSEDTYQSLLTEGYAYQRQDGTFIKLADMNEGIAVNVVKCTHPDGISEEIACDYCGMIRKHEIKDAEIVVRGANVGKFVVRPELNSAKADIVEIIFDVKIGDQVLVYNQDYEVLNESYHGTDAGEYTLRIQGKGNYSGIKEYTWTIGVHTLGLPNAGSAEKVYDGTKAVTPYISGIVSKAGISVSGGTVKMQEGTDYKILSSNFDSSDVGEDKVLTIEVELVNPNYIFENGTNTAVFEYNNKLNWGLVYKITKADVPDFTRETVLTIMNDCENTYTVDLPALPELEVPRRYGDVTYEISKVKLQDGYYTDGAKVENGRLILPIQKNNVDTTGNVGTVDVTVKSTNYNDVTLTVNVSADNRQIPVVTAPAANTLTYNGAEQALITAGSTTGGTMLYRCGDSEWSTQIPTAKNVGEYTVWYKVQGNTEYADVAEQSVTVTISEKAPEGGDSSSDGSASGGSSANNSSSNGSSSSGSSDSDDSDYNSGSSAGSSRRDSNTDKGLGKVTQDPEKGQVSSEKGIITGVSNSTVRDGYSHWMRDEHGWWLRLADNSYPKAAKNGESIAYAWEMVNGNWWAFDENGYIKTGWLRDETFGGWFYVDSERGIQTGWVQINGIWYYFHTVSDGKKGIMYADRKTPDGYYVDENGAWDGKGK